ncbi:MAG: type II toxin-antitoxin system PemK/MazF family toxin [Prevotellaceae bacterium]|nr:type II toxin-antitoxin system PemK/MazF family toxin [Prevotellaceae bacterium]
MDENSNKLLSQFKEQLRQDSLVNGIEDLQVGDIIYYDMDKADGISPKDGYNSRMKYVVVAGSKNNSKEVCAVLINTNNDYSSAKDWQSEQYLIKQSDYKDFLDHDSWIDCTDLKEIKVAKIMSKEAEKKGHLNDRDLANVMKHLKENDFITNHTRKVYGIDKYKSNTDTQ